MAIQITKNLTQVTISTAGVQGLKGEPGISGSSQDVSMFLSSSTFNTFTSSIQSEVNSIKAWTASLELINTIDTELLQLYQTTASLNTQTGSQNAVNLGISTATGSLIGITNGLMAFTAALDSTYATDAQLTQLYQTTASLQAFTSSIQSEVNSIKAWTASLELINTIDTELLQIYQTTASLNTQTGSQNSVNLGISTATGSLIGITNGLMAFTAALDSTYASDAQLLPILHATRSIELHSGSMIGITNGLMAYTSSNESWKSGIRSEISAIEAWTSSLELINTIDTELLQLYQTTASLNSKTGSYATTGSNHFYGNQIIEGNSFVELQIGESYGGGIVVYVSPSLTLIGATTDAGVNPSQQRGTMSSPDSSSIGFGSVLTDYIVSQTGAEVNAAFNAQNSVLNGFTDWFLPTSDELFYLAYNMPYPYYLTNINAGNANPTGFYYISNNSANKLFDAGALATTTLYSGQEPPGDGVNLGARTRYMRKINTNLRPTTTNNANVQITGSLNISGSFQASLTQGYMWVGGAGNVSTLIATSSLDNTYATDTQLYQLYQTTASLNSKTGSYATTGSNTFYGTQTVSGSFNVSGSTVQSGNNTLTGNTILSGSINISGSTTFNGTHTLSGSNTIVGNTLMTGTNTIIGNTEMSGSINVSGSSNFHNSIFTVTGSSFFTGSHEIRGNSIFSGSINIASGSSYYRAGNKLFNYGQWGSLETQSGSADTAFAVKLSTQFDGSEGVHIANNGSGFPTRITVQNTGLYNIQFSLQLNTAATETCDFSVWYAITGSNVANSNTDFSINKTAGGGNGVAALNFLTPIMANDYVELYWSKNTAGGRLEHKVSQSTPIRPATPSAIVTITQVA